MYLDTIDSYAHYALREPQRIDFSAMERAAIDAAYDITEIRLDLSGELAQKPCAECAGEERTFLTLETGQAFEVRGVAVPEGRATVVLLARDWKTAHPYLEMQ